MEKIGKYEIQGEIGQGAMGRVYRALDPNLRRTVALKVIRTSELEDPEQRAWMHGRFFREARTAGMLSHAHIVTVFDVGEQGDLAYIAMEYVGGSTLEEILLRPEPLEREVLLRILRQTAGALDHAHRRGVIHRDIKPSNIMLTGDGRAKIADFGIAKDLGGRDLTKDRTRPGMVLGTPSYMSPEQIQGKPLDGRSDQFALAAIAYRALTGRKPFPAEGITVLLHQILFEDIKPVEEWDPALGPAVTQMFRKALAKTPQGRYATCAEFVAELEEALRPRPKPALSGLPQGRGRGAGAEDEGGREQRYFCLAFGVLVLVVVLGAAALYWAR